MPYKPSERIRDFQIEEWFRASLPLLKIFENILPKNYLCTSVHKLTGAILAES